MAFGALLMIPAARLPSYAVTLAALFVIASGITLLQVAANPYVAVVGPADRCSRLNFVQAFNSLGTTLGPLFGGYRSWGDRLRPRRMGRGIERGGTADGARAVQLPYLIVAAVLMMLAVVIGRARLPDIGAQTRRASAQERRSTALASPQPGARGTGDFHLSDCGDWGLQPVYQFCIRAHHRRPHARAGIALPLSAVAGRMVGRFAGSMMMRFIPGERFWRGLQLPPWQRCWSPASLVARLEWRR